MKALIIAAALVMLTIDVGCTESPARSSSTSNGGSPTTTGGTTSGGMAPDSGCPADSQTVEVDTDAGPFYGTLQTPAGCNPTPLVLIYPGSGPTDQDGNDAAAGLETDAYQQLAASLAQSGMASVRYDKRCVGQSVCAITDEASFTFDDDVADGLLWAQKFATDSRFTGLTLAGHSEGSLWAILIAAQVPAVAVISLEGPGRPIGAVLGDQLVAQLAADPTLLLQANQILASLEAGMTVANVPASLQSVFAPGVQPYLISWMKYDPTKELAKLTVPILVVQGATDTQVYLQDARLLAAANPQATLLLIDGMCHVLKDAALSETSQLQAYTDPSLPLDATLVSGVTGFVLGL